MNNAAAITKESNSEFARSRKRHNNQRRTVYFVESAAAMGGVQFSTLYLVQHLNSTLWESIVVCPEEGDLTEACRRSGIAVHILNCPTLRSTSFRLGNTARLPNPLAWAWDGWAMLVAARRLARFLKQVNPDLVVTKGLFSHFYGGLAARQLGIPCVWHVQDFISERFRKIYQRLFGQAARWMPDHIIVDSASISPPVTSHSAGSNQHHSQRRRYRSVSTRYRRAEHPARSRDSYRRNGHRPCRADDAMERSALFA